MQIRPRTLPIGWYPSSAQQCQQELATFVAGVPALPAGTVVYGGVMPHAGWYFSGRLAARVFFLAAQTKQPQVVCIFGGHLGSGSLPLLVEEEAWETPLGTVLLATEMYDRLKSKIPCAPEYPGDNTIEIQLPMVKYFFPQAKVLAVRAPHSRRAMDLGQAVVQTAQELNLSLLAFGSSDLTHYGPNYGWAPQGLGPAAVQWVKEVNDKTYVDRALRLDATGVLQAAAKDQSSCSAGATAAAISAAQSQGAGKALLVDYYTSYDIRPDHSFVGYAGILFVK
ncbi:MAG: AmmeMemoRadiSam system protein B [Desulfobacca sp.]|uniref:AmmeMemoRadiSam system protein B n=1 Tax=Desulfobacca sp. TaxID=2067990 RepID=UPI0040497EB1